MLIAYKDAVIKALEAKDLQSLKQLQQLKGKEILEVDSIDQLKNLQANDYVGFLFSKQLLYYLETNWIKHCLYEDPFEYADIYEPDMSRDAVLRLSQKLESEI